jgi:hypothetical protein
VLCALHAACTLRLMGAVRLRVLAASVPDLRVQGSSVRAWHAT